MRKKVLMFAALIVICFLSCTKNKRRSNALAIVREWTGKEIKFPENIPCYILGKDTLPEHCEDFFQKDYKILLYVDSTGCSSCRLKLFEWKQLIGEANSLFPDKVGFLLFFQPKNLSGIDYLFIQDRFDHPVFIDTKDEINRLNHFPQAIQYQCFLLDSDNNVLMIGNPVLNMKIWELYKSLIAGGEKTETKVITTIILDKVEHDLGIIQKGSVNLIDFQITNTGNNPLIITRISNSCGCTKVTWDKQPIESENTTTISVELTPDEIGVLRKSITVYSNTNESPVRIILIGTVIE